MHRQRFSYIISLACKFMDGYQNSFEQTGPRQTPMVPERLDLHLAPHRCLINPILSSEQGRLGMLLVRHSNSCLDELYIHPERDRFCVFAGSVMYSADVYELGTSVLLIRMYCTINPAHPPSLFCNFHVFSSIENGNKTKPFETRPGDKYYEIARRLGTTTFVPADSVHEHGKTSAWGSISKRALPFPPIVGTGVLPWKTLTAGDH